MKKFNVIELFAGCGGMALGFEQAGLNALLLNEKDRSACQTLSINRGNTWNVKCCDVKDLDFTDYKLKVDVVSGGFPCQAFSYSGKKLGFEDTRGTLFFEFIRAVREIQPKVFVAENVKGLLSHDGGKTIETMRAVIETTGYNLVPIKLLKAVDYGVPQKRERVFLVGIRKDISNFVDFKYPTPYDIKYNLKDALKRGKLYSVDVPRSRGQEYNKYKISIMSLVPPGGCWRDLPDALQREYMMKSYFLGGGKTGMARRLSWDEPSLTLTCSPAQKQTERCHPDETRPLTIREYARIQTFPDDWEFFGSLSSQYKQIGNAVPVNLAFELGKSIVKELKKIC